MGATTISTRTDGFMAQEYDVLIERDQDGVLVASVPAPPGCHTQARSLDELMERVKEAIALCLEERGQPSDELTFVGIQRVRVS
jgi:predicted RNase H-like HicB family nuclease